jgi:hypothetical protein
LLSSKDPLIRAFDAVIGNEIRKLNTHLPKKRETLSELLKRTDPTVQAADGSSVLLKKSELEELAKTVPKEYHDRLRLPIVVLRRMELGKSTYTVAGDSIEEFTVRRILGETDADYSTMYLERPPFYLYRPQIVELLRKYHNLFMIGFGVPKELADYGLSRD